MRSKRQRRVSGDRLLYYRGGKMEAYFTVTIVVGIAISMVIAQMAFSTDAPPAWWIPLLWGVPLTVFWLLDTFVMNTLDIRTETSRVGRRHFRTSDLEGIEINWTDEYEANYIHWLWFKVPGKQGRDRVMMRYKLSDNDKQELVDMFKRALPGVPVSTDVKRMEDYRSRKEKDRDIYLGRKGALGPWRRR